MKQIINYKSLFFMQEDIFRYLRLRQLYRQFLDMGLSEASPLFVFFYCTARQHQEARSAIIYGHLRTFEFERIS